MKGRVTCEARNCKRINGQQRLFSLHEFTNYCQKILITAHAVSLNNYKTSILMCIVYYALLRFKNTAFPTPRL